MNRVALVLAAAVGSGRAVEQQVSAVTNPIRRVVTMLQSMQKKVGQQGKDEEELYVKFMCYCKTGSGDLDASVSAANTKIPAVTSSIEASEAKLAQAKQDLKQAQSDRSAAKGAMAEATALREREASDYATFKSDADANIAAMAKAVTALENGMGGSFLQTPAAEVLSRLAMKSASGVDQQILTAFLSQSSQYAPQSGEVTGILKHMGDTMVANLADATSTEEKAIDNYKGLIGAKTKEVAATTSIFESKTKQIGELGVSLVNMKEDLSDTQDTLAEDETFLAELKKSCGTKTAEWEERSKTRADELVALADTIKVLNDDDALELFKKTLPSTSLIQLQFSSRALQKEAVATVRAALWSANRLDRPGLELVALALAGKTASKGGFDKVVGMIDNMVGVLGKEQQDDTHKKEYCAAQFDLAEDKVKALNRDIETQSNGIETAEETIATLTDELAALAASIKALDKSVAEATEQRKEENTEFKASVAANIATKELLIFAKNRLNKFYNPKLHKVAPKREFSSQDRIVDNFGGEVATTTPGGIADTGITAFSQISLHRQGRAAPSPPPETWDAYKNKGEESSGVIALIDLLIADVEKEMTEAKTDEKDAQADYEEMMKDAAEKRTTDSKALAAKDAAKADTESDLQSLTEGKAATGKELMATLKYAHALHTECDWLLQYFDVRKQARADEVDALKKAKAVLSGADYSLIQVRGRRFLGR